MKAGALCPLLVLLAAPVMVLVGDSGSLRPVISGVLTASVDQAGSPRSGDPAGSGNGDPMNGAGQAAGEKAAASPHPATIPYPIHGYNLRVGKTLFDHYCLPCHGERGAGDGFNAYNLDPRPRDLGDPEFQKDRNDADLLAIMSSGGGAAGLSTGMPPWGHTLTRRQMGNLVLYLRSLARPAAGAGDPSVTPE